MKKIIALLTALLLTIAATAQRLRVGEQSSGMGRLHSGKTKFYFVFPFILINLLLVGQ
jgi:hypothetical protein